MLAQEWDGEWELVVVDNGSTDGTLEVVEGFRDRSRRLRVLSATERGSRPYAVAVGVESTNAPMLVFIDADDVVGDRWLPAIADGLANHPVVTGPNELHELNPPWLATSRGESGDDPVGMFHGLFPTIRGNNYAMRRSVLDEVGPLAEGYFPVDDVEFSLRCWLRGIDSSVCPTQSSTIATGSRSATCGGRAWRTGRTGPSSPGCCGRRGGRPRPLSRAGSRGSRSFSGFPSSGTARAGCAGRGYGQPPRAGGGFDPEPHRDAVNPK